MTRKRETLPVMYCEHCKMPVDLEDERNFVYDKELIGNVIHCGKCKSRVVVPAKLCRECGSYYPAKNGYCGFCASKLYIALCNVAEKKSEKEIFSFMKYTLVPDCC